MGDIRLEVERIENPYQKVTRISSTPRSKPNPQPNN